MWRLLSSPFLKRHSHVVPFFCHALGLLWLPRAWALSLPVLPHFGAQSIMDTFPSASLRHARLIPVSDAVLFMGVGREGIIRQVPAALHVLDIAELYLAHVELCGDASGVGEWNQTMPVHPIGHRLGRLDKVPYSYFPPNNMFGLIACK